MSLIDKKIQIRKKKYKWVKKKKKQMKKKWIKL